MTQLNSLNALDVVLDYHHKWTHGMIDKALALLSEDFVCHAPVGALGKKQFREYLAGFVPKLTGIKDITQFTDRDRVVLLYYPQTAVTDATPAAEYFTLRDGLIVESVLIFDRLAYAPPNNRGSDD